MGELISVGDGRENVETAGVFSALAVWVAALSPGVGETAFATP